MRFFSIEITNPDSGDVQVRYSSLNADGSNNPNCVRVNFDIPFFNASTPSGNAFVRIYGVPYSELNQSGDLINSKFTMYGGMSKGLPLAKPEQQGIILKGRVWQAFGNWQGTDITLDLVVVVGDTEIQQLPNFPIIWEKGTTLTDAVRKALKTAEKNEDLNIQGYFDPRLIAPSDQSGTYNSVYQLSQAVYSQSKAIITDQNYLGAQICKTNNGYVLFDNSTQASPKKLAFTDFIGNATYVKYSQINFKLVLRADLMVGDVITMPPQSNIANTVNTFTKFRDNISFQNNFRISQIRHVGDSRQLSADSWCTIVDAYLLTEEQNG